MPDGCSVNYLKWFDAFLKDNKGYFGCEMMRGPGRFQAKTEKEPICYEDIAGPSLSYR